MSSNTSITHRRIALIANGSFRNKGDALMAQALIERLEGNYALAFPVRAAIYSFRHLARYHTVLVSDLPAESVKRQLFTWGVGLLNAVARTLPPPWRLAIRCITEDDADVIFDLSGYCFGDHWGEERVKHASAGYERWARKGKKIVLMPKTWGPFETIGAHHLNSMFQWVTIAFARDQRSLATLRDLLSPENARKLHFAPDYTHEVAPLRPTISAKGAYLIIPSYRMIDSGTLSRDGYTAFIRHARNMIAETRCPVRLVLHESSMDVWFKDHAAAMGFGDDDVFVLDDERELKGLIAQSRGVVTSRLHGLYNSLNSGVPVLVAAWSFKYAEALRQYGCEQCLLDSDDVVASFGKKVSLLTDGDLRADLIARMRKGKNDSARATTEMWRIIEEALDGPIVTRVAAALTATK